MRHIRSHTEWSDISADSLDLTRLENVFESSAKNSRRRRKYGICLTGSDMKEQGMYNNAGEALKEGSRLLTFVTAGLDRYDRC